MAISIKELARLAGVSVTTIARALHGKPDINEETRERVLELAKQYNYRPNVLARGLVTNRSYTVGIIVPDITNPFFPAMIKGAEAALWELGYNVIFADADYDPRKEVQIIEGMVSRRVDGIIISPTDTSEHPDWLAVLQSSETPTVSVTRLERTLVDTVVAADRDGAETATTHLLAQGRSRILYLGNTSASWANHEREEGYRSALGTADTEACVHATAHGTPEEAQALVASLIDGGLTFDGILAFDDVMALGAHLALAERELRVPDDVALIGFDNVQLSRFPEVALTTVDIPKYEIGRVASERILTRIEEAHARKQSKYHNTAAKEIVLQTKLIIRKTCGASAKAGPVPQ